MSYPTQDSIHFSSKVSCFLPAIHLVVVHVVRKQSVKNESTVQLPACLSVRKGPFWSFLPLLLYSLLQDEPLGQMYGTYGTVGKGGPSYSGTYEYTYCR